MTPRDEAAAFCAAILANPADDTTRLVFADWLEEHGSDPVRAKIIRVGVEYPELTLTAFRRALVSREEVWDFNGADLVIPRSVERLRAELPAPNRVPGVLSFTYRRGFVEAVRLPWAAWCRENTAEVFRSVYPITRVDLTNEPEVEFWKHFPHESHAWVYGAWVSAQHNAVTDRNKTLHFCGLRWPGVTFTSPRARR